MTPEAAPTNPAQPTPTSAELLESECPYFDERHMSPPTNGYVCWIDVMGSQDIMLRSLRIASNFLMKLHIAAIRASTQYHSVELFPIIDGIYVFSTSQSHVLNFLKKVYTALAATFIREENPFHRFLIRGGLAYGPVIKGEGTLGCANELRDNPNHARRIILGPALTQAYHTEKLAAPFGVALHESARSFAPPQGVVMFTTYWQWWKLHTQPIDRELVTELLASLTAHYEWCSKHTVALSYQKDAIDRHKLLALEYFSD